tara:strand:+ start:1022 stop:1576 length:555 start_codon:yes stop_codon:yes gene_type:complete
MIHPTHPKKDLIEIIELFEFYDIDDYRELSKDDLRHILWNYIRKCKKIEPDDEFFFVDDVKSLLKYLNSPCPRQHMTEVVREDISDKCKNLIFYCRACQYSIASSNFIDIDEILQTAEDIAKFGDTPMVRRALNLLNQDKKMPYKIEPILTPRMERKLQRLKDARFKMTGKLKVTPGKVLVVFD